MKTLNDLIYDAMGKGRRELAIGFLRYEAVRKLKPVEFKQLWTKCMGGYRFDDLADELIKKNL